MASSRRSTGRTIGVAVIACLALAACEPDRPKTMQSGVPGHVSAGGASSGELIAGNKGASRDPSGPEGTPGIPKGSGGTTGGPEMGGTQQADAGSKSAASGTGSGQNAKKEKTDASAAADAEAAKQKERLAAAMDRAAERSWTLAAGGGGAGAPGASDAQPGASAAQPRSEKHGTAVPSEDVKQPRQQSPDASGASLPSDTYREGN